MSVSPEIIKKYISGELVDPLFPNDPAIRPTANVYKGNVDGYTAERSALHDAIVAQHLEGKTQKGEKQFIAIAGGMSVGMTYMIRLLENQGIVDKSKFVSISPMSLTLMPEFKERDHYQHPERSPFLVSEYYHVVRKILKIAIAKGLSVAFVDMGDRAEEMLGALQQAQQNQYASALFGLTVKEEGYFTATNAWQTLFNRIADHPRALRMMRDFTRNWGNYVTRFDNSLLVETEFKDGVHWGHLVAHAAINGPGSGTWSIIEQSKYDDFSLRKFININGKDGQEASQYDIPQQVNTSSEFRQAFASLSTSARAATDTELKAALHNLCDDGFGRKFAEESLKKLEARRQRAATTQKLEAVS